MAAFDEESFDSLPQSDPSGTLLLVKNPLGSGNVEAVVKETLRVNVAECNVGKTHSIVEVKDSSRNSSSLLLEQDKSMVEAVFLETVSITISGDKLPSIGSVIEICTEINSHNLKCDLSNAGQDITIRGSWNHVKLAREKIQCLIMDSVYHDDNRTTCSSTLPHHDGSTIDSTDNRIHSAAGSRATGTYTECISVSPHVMKMMKRKNINFGLGASHTEGSSSVLFQFQSEEELDAAIDRFQSQANIFEEDLLPATIAVPQGIHKDENFALIVSELETKYEDTMITWIDGKIEIEVITNKLSMDLVMRDLNQMMQDQVALPTGNIVVKHSAGNSTNNSPGNFMTRAFDFFRQPIVPPPVIEYQKQVVLTFPDNRSITLKHGNILDETVDAIVNPANEKLTHSGGLAKQIDKASHGAVKRQSDNLLRQIASGRIPTGMVVRTGAGNGKLRCNYVFHAIGPNAHEIRSERECQDLLNKTIKNITNEACKACCNTIAVPAISSGVFGMEKDIVAEIIIRVLVDFQQQRPNHDFLKDIRVVIWDRETYDPFLTIVLGVKNSFKYH